MLFLFRSHASFKAALLVYIIRCLRRPALAWPLMLEMYSCVRLQFLTVCASLLMYGGVSLLPH